MLKHLGLLKKEEEKEIVIELKGAGYTKHSSVCQGYRDAYSQLKWHMEKEDEDLIIKRFTGNHIVLTTESDIKKSRKLEEINKLEKVMKKSMGQIEDYIKGKSVKTLVYAIQTGDNKIYGLYNDKIKAELIRDGLEINGYSNVVISPIEVE